MKALANGIFRLLSWVPASWAMALSHGIARISVAVGARGAKVARTNIDHCFPQLDADARRVMVLNSVASAALLVFEFAYFRYHHINKLLGRIRGVEGEELLGQAWAAGHGVVVLMPHFGSWEFLSIFLGKDYAVSALYEPPHVAALESNLLATRQRQGAKMYPTNGAGLRGLMRGLKSGDVVVVLPDQVPASPSARVEATFFGRKALTMTLAQRLARVGSPKVLLAAAWREKDSKTLGYRLCFKEPGPDFYSDDLAVHASAMNAGIEAIVRRDPAQYQWTYKRFRGFNDEIDEAYRRQ